MKKIISLLLAIIMVLGMLPLSALAEEISITKPQVAKNRNVYTFDQLKVALESEENLNIKLTANIFYRVAPIKVCGQLHYSSEDRYETVDGEDFVRYFYSANGNPTDFEYEDVQIKAVGKKILDLNGYDITVEDNSNVWFDEDGESYTSGNIDKSLITVTDNASLLIRDGTSNPGTIHYDAYMYTTVSGERKKAYYYDYAVRDIIRVEDAELIVNGGILEAGRSKKQYIMAGALEPRAYQVGLGIYDAIDFLFHGNAYQQIWGSAIKCCEGAEVVINGGKFYGRGEGYIGGSMSDSPEDIYKGLYRQVIQLEDNVYSRDAVIDCQGYSDFNIVINGGEFYAKGGANIFSGKVTQDIDIKVNAGGFYLDKVDYVRCPDMNCDTEEQVEIIVRGTYGSINIKDYYCEDINGRAVFLIPNDINDPMSNIKRYYEFPTDEDPLAMTISPTNSHKRSYLLVNHGSKYVDSTLTYTYCNGRAPFTLTLDYEPYYIETDTMDDYMLRYTWNITGTLSGESVEKTWYTFNSTKTIDPTEIMDIGAIFDGTLTVTCTVEELRQGATGRSMKFSTEPVTIVGTEAPIVKEALPEADITVDVIYPDSGDVTSHDWPVIINVSPTTADLRDAGYNDVKVTRCVLVYTNEDGQIKTVHSFDNSFEIDDLDTHHNTVKLTMHLYDSEETGYTLIEKEFDVIRHVGYSTSNLHDGFGVWNSNKTSFVPFSSSGLTLNSNLVTNVYDPRDPANEFTQSEINWYRQTGYNTSKEEYVYEKVASNSYSYYVTQSGRYCLGVTSRDGVVVYNRPIGVFFDEGAAEFSIKQNGRDDVVVNAKGIETTQSFTAYSSSGNLGGTYKWKIVGGPEGWENTGLKKVYSTSNTTIGFSNFVRSNYDYTRIIPGVYTLQAERYVSDELVAVSNAIEFVIMRKADTCEIHIDGVQAKYDYTLCRIGNTYNFKFAAANGADYPGIKNISWNIETLVGTNVATITNGVFTPLNPGRVRVTATGKNASGTYTDTIVIDVPIETIEIIENDIVEGANWADVLKVPANAPYDIEVYNIYASGDKVIANTYPAVQVNVIPKAGYVFLMLQNEDGINEWETTTNLVEFVLSGNATGRISNKFAYGALPKNGPFGSDPYYITSEPEASFRIDFPFAESSSTTYHETLNIGIDIPNVGDICSDDLAAGFVELADMTLSQSEFLAYASIVKVEAEELDDDPSNDNCVDMYGGEYFEEGQLYRICFTVLPKDRTKDRFANDSTITVNGNTTVIPDYTEKGFQDDIMLSVYYYFYAETIEQYTVSGMVSGVEDDTRVRILLYEDELPEPAYEVIVTGNSEYVIEDVFAAKYTIIAYAEGYDDFSADINVNRDVVYDFSMQPSVPVYVVTFKFDDTPIAWQEVKQGECAEMDPPSLENVAFAGWYTDNGELFDFSTPILSDITLTAKFVSIGDVNADGKINVVDIVRLKKYFANDETIYDELYDVDGDLSITAEDLVALRKMLLAN